MKLQIEAVIFRSARVFLLKFRRLYLMTTFTELFLKTTCTWFFFLIFLKLYLLLRAFGFHFPNFIKKENNAKFPFVGTC